MTDYLSILKSISLPIVLLISMGYFFQKKMKISVKAYSKTLLFLFTPVVIFMKMYEMDITWDFFVHAMSFVIVYQTLMVLISVLLSKILKYPKSKKKAMSNSLVLFNSGNYGIPLIDLSFKSHPVAMASQLFIIITQSILSNTFGVFQASYGSGSKKQALKNVLKMPAPYTIFLIAIIKIASIQIPEPILIPLNYISIGFIGFALIALGAQLAEIKLQFKIKEMLPVCFVKLLLAPVIGFLLVFLFNIKGILAQALIIGVSTPTAVTSAILAQEFDNEREFAAHAVVMTTVLCTFTLPLTINLVQKYIS